MDEEDSIAEQQINEMLQIGVIEPTKSAQYNSPCFLVNKKNNEKRFVLDLRSLNAAIMPELVQLPKVTELIDDITSKHCKVFGHPPIFTITKEFSTDELCGILLMFCLMSASSSV